MYTSTSSCSFCRSSFVVRRAGQRFCSAQCRLTHGSERRRRALALLDRLEPDADPASQMSGRQDPMSPFPAKRGER